MPSKPNFEEIKALKVEVSQLKNEVRQLQENFNNLRKNRHSFIVLTRLQDENWEKAGEYDTKQQAVKKVKEMIRQPLGHCCMYQVVDAVGNFIWKPSDEDFENES